MKSISAGMQAHLDSGTTTLAWCWRITRQDGTAFGFTDRDLPLSFDGTAFDPETGLIPSGIGSFADGFFTGILHALLVLNDIPDANELTLLTEWAKSITPEK